MVNYCSGTTCFLGTLIVILTALVLFFFPMIARPGERGWPWAVLGYSVPVFGTLLLFPANYEFAAVVLVVLAFGDSAAEVGGVLFGRRRLPWNPAKTWAGLASFLLCASPLATVAFWWDGKRSHGCSLRRACGSGGSGCGVSAFAMGRQHTHWPRRRLHRRTRPCARQCLRPTIRSY